MEKQFPTTWRTGFNGQNIQKPSLSLENTQILQVIQCCINCQLVTGFIPYIRLHIIQALAAYIARKRGKEFYSTLRRRKRTKLQ